MTELATQHRCLEQLRERWPHFLEQRSARLVQQERFGAAEKVAENILEDLFTRALDWPLSDFNNHVEYADIVLTSAGIKHLLIEAKRPGAVRWSRRAVEEALAQARRYADEQRVTRIAVSDGTILYGAKLAGGGLQDRLFVRLDDAEAPEALWWLSVHGIYRDHATPTPALDAREAEPPAQQTLSLAPAELLHPKYHLPARCFGYLGRADDPHTWKLPYRLVDGSVDTKRLPGAIRCIVTNYRGERIGGIPEKDVPEVLVRLGIAAREIGRMPGRSHDVPETFQQLHKALTQLDRLGDSGLT